MCALLLALHCGTDTLLFLTEIHAKTLQITAPYLILDKLSDKINI